MKQKDESNMETHSQPSRPHPAIRRVLILSVCLAVLVTGCGGDGDGTGVRDDQGSIEITPEDLMEEIGRQEDAPDCDDFYRDGATTTDEMDGTLCKRADGELFVPGTARRTCTDGREVMWNDEGWGFLGESWQRHSDQTSKSPPQDVLDECPA